MHKRSPLPDCRACYPVENQMMGFIAAITILAYIAGSFIFTMACVISTFAELEPKKD